MASDWIKMRTDLYRDPKISQMADCLMDPDGLLAGYISQNEQRNMTVTRNVIRNATVGSLVTVWGVMRHQGKRVGDDLLMPKTPLSAIDDAAEMVGFAEAMMDCGWLTETAKGLCFPRFFESNNVDPKADPKEKAAERQKRYRDRKRSVTRDVTDTSQSNARVRERETPLIPQGGDSFSSQTGETIQTDDESMAIIQQLRARRANGGNGASD